MLPRTILFIGLGNATQNVMDAIQSNEEGIGMKFYLTLSLVLISSLGLIFLFKKKSKCLR
jgi:glucose uptake protein GlcU